MCRAWSCLVVHDCFLLGWDVVLRGLAVLSVNDGKR